jgi:hypothetical protein
MAVNNSKPGGREERHRVVQEMRNGKIKILDEYPTEDMASKMYQSWKHDLRENSNKDTGTLIKLQKVVKISTSENMNWDSEVHSTTKTATIKPYSDRYSARMKKIRGY